MENGARNGKKRDIPAELLADGVLIGNSASGFGAGSIGRGSSERLLLLLRGRVGSGEVQAQAQLGRGLVGVLAFFRLVGEGVPLFNRLSILQCLHWHCHLSQKVI